MHKSIYKDAGRRPARFAPRLLQSCCVCSRNVLYSTCSFATAALSEFLVDFLSTFLVVVSCGFLSRFRNYFCRCSELIVHWITSAVGLLGLSLVYRRRCVQSLSLWEFNVAVHWLLRSRLAFCGVLLSFRDGTNWHMF